MVDQLGDVNRAVLVVKPKRPFLDWLRETEDPPAEATLEFLRKDCNAYLIPVVESDEDERRVIRRYHKRLFENELTGWLTNKSQWPKRRGLETFLTWFEVEIHSVVTDLAKDARW